MRKTQFATFAFIFIFSISGVLAKEVALTFDDAPNASTLHFKSSHRTSELIRKLKVSNVSSAMIFANACKGINTARTLAQLKSYRDNGHIIANHTCSHHRLDKVGFSTFSEDALKGDKLLKPLIEGERFFRFPYLNEGTDPELRNKMRDWLKRHEYRNGIISGDNEDPTFSAKINEAKVLGKEINYDAVKELFLEHIIGSLECNDKLAIKYLGRSPKHVLLLHEADATVMFIDSLVDKLRSRGWKIINPIDAYTDDLYTETPQNTYSGFGIISQVVFEKTGKKSVCYDYPSMLKKLNYVLGLEKKSN